MKYVRVFQTTVLDKNEKCINRVSFAENTDDNAKLIDGAKSVKARMLEKPNTTYSCIMCGETHDLKDAIFTQQQSTLVDSSDPHETPWLEKCGEDEFMLTAIVDKINKSLP